MSAQQLTNLHFVNFNIGYDSDQVWEVKIGGVIFAIQILLCYNFTINFLFQCSMSNTNTLSGKSEGSVLARE